MGHEDLFNFIWIRSQGLAVIVPQKEVLPPCAAAAIVIKAEDGTDQFVPYDGYLEGGPIGFFVGKGTDINVRIVGFGGDKGQQDIAQWFLDTEIGWGNGASDELDADKVYNFRLIGFGERVVVQQREAKGVIGRVTSDYSIEGEVDFGALLGAFHDDLRSGKDSSFTAFFVTAVPFDGTKIGPAVFLKPLHQFRFSLRSEINVSEGDYSADEEEQLYADAGGEANDTALNDTALVSRHVNRNIKIFPEFTLFAGQQREQLDFVIGNGSHLLWRRQYERGDDLPLNDNDNATYKPGTDFILTPFSERRDLISHEGGYYLHWAIPDVVIGDVVGVIFNSQSADVRFACSYDGDDEVWLREGCEALFIFSGSEFIPLTDEVLNHPDNIGLKTQLEASLEEGFAHTRSLPYMHTARTQNTTAFLSRDGQLKGLLGSGKCDEISSAAPFGPEFELYRDHVLRAEQSQDMQEKLLGLSSGADATLSGLFLLLDYEIFSKRPDLAHLFIFNEKFRAKFHSKPLWPTSFSKPIIDLLMEMMGFDDQVIDWAVNLRGEGQAILWQLCLNRPKMVEKLFDLKIEPDMALNPYDNEVLDHAEYALNDSGYVTVSELETKVVPILEAAGEAEKITELKEYIRLLSFGAAGKSLRLGELTVCLTAIEKARSIWTGWGEQTVSLFSELITPLNFEIPDYETLNTYTVQVDLDHVQREISNLIQRLIEELGVSDQIGEAALTFITQLNSEALLTEIKSKLDLAHKYHRDLSIGVGRVREQFNVSEKEIARIAQIKASEWPDMEVLPGNFSKSILKRQKALKTELDEMVRGLAQRAHPGDELFYETLKQALKDVDELIEKLVWIEFGSELETKRDELQLRLKEALVRVHPTVAKLRNSKPLAKAIREMIIAERLGPKGWSNMVRCLSVIEKALPHDLV